MYHPGKSSGECHRGSEAEPKEAAEREYLVSEKYAAYRNRKQQRREDENRTGQIPYYKGR